MGIYIINGGDRNLVKAAVDGEKHIKGKRRQFVLQVPRLFSGGGFTYSGVVADAIVEPYLEPGVVYYDSVWFGDLSHFDAIYPVLEKAAEGRAGSVVANFAAALSVPGNRYTQRVAELLSMILIASDVKVGVYPHPFLSDVNLLGGTVPTWEHSLDSHLIAAFLKLLNNSYTGRMNRYIEDINSIMFNENGTTAVRQRLKFFVKVFRDVSNMSAYDARAAIMRALDDDADNVFSGGVKLLPRKEYDATVERAHDEFNRKLKEDTEGKQEDSLSVDHSDPDQRGRRLLDEYKEWLESRRVSTGYDNATWTAIQREHARRMFEEFLRRMTTPADRIPTSTPMPPAEAFTYTYGTSTTDVRLEGTDE